MELCLRSQLLQCIRILLLSKMLLWRSFSVFLKNMLVAIRRVWMAPGYIMTQVYDFLFKEQLILKPLSLLLYFSFIPFHAYAVQTEGLYPLKNLLTTLKYKAMMPFDSCWVTILRLQHWRQFSPPCNGFFVCWCLHKQKVCLCRKCCNCYSEMVLIKFWCHKRRSYIHVWLSQWLTIAAHMLHFQLRHTIQP